MQHGRMVRFPYFPARCQRAGRAAQNWRCWIGYASCIYAICPRGEAWADTCEENRRRADLRSGLHASGCKPAKRFWAWEVDVHLASYECAGVPWCCPYRMRDCHGSQHGQPSFTICLLWRKSSPCGVLHGFFSNSI